MHAEMIITYIFDYRFMRGNFENGKNEITKDPDKKRKSYHMGKYF